MRTLRAVTSAAALSLALLVPHAARAESVRIAKTGAEVRGKAGFAGPVLARPAVGDVLDAVERANEWVRVELPGGASGWIHEVFVAPAAAGATSAPVAPPATATRTLPHVAPVPPPSSTAALHEPAEAAMPAAVPPDAAAPAASPAHGDDAPTIEQWRTQALALESENRALRGMLADASAAGERLRDERDEARADGEARATAERAEGEQAAERRCAEKQEPAPPEAAISAAREAGRLDALAEAREDARKELRSDEAETQRLDAARAEERQSVQAAHDEELAKLEADQLAVLAKFIATVTQKHEEELARSTASAKADCEDRLVAERRDHEKELRVAKRESGWEADFEKAVRDRLDAEVLEAKARWEAKRRGEQYDEARVRQDEGDRVRRECEGERLAAVSRAHEEAQAESARTLAAVRAEADHRCQVALELVLERVAEGGDLAGVRKLVPSAAAPAAGTPDAPATQPQPVPVPQPQPQPIEPTTSLGRPEHDAPPTSPR